MKDEGHFEYYKNTLLEDIEGHELYWLIGVLTYCGYMDKNYKQ